MSLLLDLLSSIYLCEPSREVVASWKKLEIPADSGILGDFGSALESIDTDSREGLQELQWEYTRLFIGPYRLSCPPWESVYTSPKKLLMQEAAAEVAGIYRDAGLVAHSPELMPDHVGVELNFLSVLLKRIGGSEDDKSIAAARTFLHAHLLNWVPQFTSDLENVSVMLFYKKAARATRTTLALIADEFQKL